MRSGVHLGLVILIAVVAACGGATPASPAGSPSVGATAAAAPTATPVPAATAAVGPTLEDAAATYLAFVTDWNARGDALGVQFEAAGDDPAVLGAAWAANAALDEDFIAGLDAIDFPDSVAPVVRALRDATDAIVRVERLLAGDPTDPALQGQMDALTPVASAAAADLRRVLGLPPVVASAPTPEPVAQGPKRYQPGELITIAESGDPVLSVVVSEVKSVKSYPGEFGSDKPDEPGNVFIQAYVTYTALADGASYNSFDWQVFADDTAVDGFTFLLNGPEPTLGSGTLPRGRKAKGWLVYEVPARGEVLLSYGSQFSFNDEPPLFEIVLRD